MGWVHYIYITQCVAYISLRMSDKCGKCIYQYKAIKMSICMSVCLCICICAV